MFRMPTFVRPPIEGSTIELIVMVTTSSSVSNLLVASSLYVSVVLDFQINVLS